jgi:hypothetical protein
MGKDKGLLKRIDAVIILPEGNELTPIERPESLKEGDLEIAFCGPRLLDVLLGAGVTAKEYYIQEDAGPEGLSERIRDVDPDAKIVIYGEKDRT